MPAVSVRPAPTPTGPCVAAPRRSVPAAGHRSPSPSSLPPRPHLLTLFRRPRTPVPSLVAFPVRSAAATRVQRGGRRRPRTMCPGVAAAPARDQVVPLTEGRDGAGPLSSCRAAARAAMFTRPSAPSGFSATPAQPAAAEPPVAVWTAATEPGAARPRLATVASLTGGAAVVATTVVAGAPSGLDLADYNPPWPAAAAAASFPPCAAGVFTVDAVPTGGGPPVSGLPLPARCCTARRRGGRGRQRRRTQLAAAFVADAAAIDSSVGATEARSDTRGGEVHQGGRAGGGC